MDIDYKKVDIDYKKVDIGSLKFSKRTVHHIEILFDEYGYNRVFGRSDLMVLVVLKSSAVYNFISKLLDMVKENMSLRIRCDQHLFNLI